VTQTALPVEQRAKCIHLKKDGTRCTRWARAGEDRCRQHAGMAAPRQPTALDDDAQDRLFDALKAGLALEDACVLAEVSRSTVYDWLAKARQEGTHPRYREFEAGVERARLSLERTTLEQLTKEAAKGNVRAMTWLLERLHPERYVRRAGGQLQMPTEPQRGKSTGDREEDVPDNNVVQLRPVVGDVDF